MGKKFIFNLKIIDENEIIKKYSFLSSETKKDFGDITKLTKITDLTKVDNTNYTFLNEIKREKHCEITMKDYILKKKLPELTDVFCFWCNNHFNTTPIGCPIRYIPTNLTNQYKSVITDDDYRIKENVTSYKRKKINENKDSFLSNNQKNIKQRINLNEKDFFETDGVFCSFNCCLSYIKYNEHSSIYNISENLLHLMYFKIFNKNDKISPAPSWRLLRQYGGNLSIENFRKNFNNVNYNYMGTITKIVKNKPIGYIFEKNIKI